jgi:hypothetical protein
MRKLVVTLTAASALVLGSALVVSANPFSLGASSPDHSSIEKVGCSRSSSNDTCPYGYTPGRHGCEPCGWNERHGSRYRDWDERYYKPRRYRDYDHGYYGPRKYPRSYY